MRVIYILDEDFVNYKKPSMLIGCVKCNGKCFRDLGLSCDICQNWELQQSTTIEINDDKLCQRYLNNKLTNAIVFGGLEPFDQFDELVKFIDVLRNKYGCDDDIVIYTGYDYSEIYENIDKLKEFENIIVKFGRYIPDSEPVYDTVLGVELISNNQFAINLSHIWE